MRGWFSADYIPLFPVNDSPSVPDWFHLWTSNISTSNGLWLDCFNEYVCNPTTRKVSTHIPFPDPKDFGEKCSILSLTLCFDPAKSPYYKIVCLMQNYVQETSHLLIQIYSSHTSSWSSSGEQLTGCLSDSKSVYWNGAVHWVSKEQSLYFDVDDQMLKTFPSPPGAIDDYYFGVSCDHMHYAETSSLQFDFYELKRDRSEWFSKYRVDLSPLAGAYPNMVSAYSPVKLLSLVGGAAEKDSFLVLQVDLMECRFNQVIMRYNIVSNTFEELHAFDEDEYHIQVFQHIESLCPV